MKKTRVPKTWKELEDMVKHKELRAVRKIEKPKYTIALAETDYLPPNIDHPWGFYQTLYVVAGSASHGNPDIGQWLEYDAMEGSDKGLTQEERRRGRERTTIAIAEDFATKNVEVGRYV